MKELMMIAAAAALLIGASEVAVHRFDDRALFVPPPDAVAEAFVRELTTRRFEQSAEYLAVSTSTSALRDAANAIERSIGRVDDVKSELISWTKDKALVRVQIRSAKGHESLVLETVWTHGEWRVARLP